MKTHGFLIRESYLSVRGNYLLKSRDTFSHFVLPLLFNHKENKVSLNYTLWSNKAKRWKTNTSSTLEERSDLWRLMLLSSREQTTFLLFSIIIPALLEKSIPLCQWEKHQEMRIDMMYETLPS